MSLLKDFRWGRVHFSKLNIFLLQILLISRVTLVQREMVVLTTCKQFVVPKRKFTFVYLVTFVYLFIVNEIRVLGMTCLGRVRRFRSTVSSARSTRASPIQFILKFIEIVIFMTRFVRMNSPLILFTSQLLRTFRFPQFLNT